MVRMLLKLIVAFGSFIICNFLSFRRAFSANLASNSNAEDFSIIPRLPDIGSLPLEPLYENSIILNFSIPPITGLVISPFYDSEIEKTLWVGRVQHSILSIRPDWVTVYGIDGIMSLKNCKGIIADAEKFASTRVDPTNPLSTGWMTDRHPNHATTDLPVRSIFGDSRLHDYLTDILLPHYRRCYGIDPLDLYIADLFIVKYTGEQSGSGQSFLESHRDRSPFSFVVSLNDDFEGGGTFFPQIDQLWKPKVGGAVLFHGQSMHGGAKVVSGTRYIIAGFVEYNDEFDTSSKIISHENKFKSFMKYYSPQTDGTAAQFGFRSGDIVRGIEACYTSLNTDIEVNHDANTDSESIEFIASTGSDEVAPIGSDRVFRRMVSLDLHPVSPPLWSVIASSCELLQPSANTNMIVERRVKLARHERKLDY